MAGSGFSMALGSKPKKPVPAATGGFGGGSRNDDDEEDGGDAQRQQQPEFVSEIVDGKVDGKKEVVRVIPALQNTFALGGAQHLRGMLEPEPTADSHTDPAPESRETDGPPAHEEKDPAVNDDANAAHAILSELRAGGTSIFASESNASASASLQIPDNDTDRYRLDVATRAEETTKEAYESMPIEDFGKAYLRGLGWEEGKPVGTGAGQAIVEPIEYVPRPQLLGLGAQPKKDEKDEKKKRFTKPGESREPKKDMIYVDEHGRQRHVKKIGEKLVEREKTGFVKDALIAVTAGVHKGLYGRVLSTGGMDSDLKVVLRLTTNDEQVTVSAADCEPVRDAQLERSQPGFTHRQHALKASSGGEVGGAAAGSGAAEGIGAAEADDGGDAADANGDRSGEDGALSDMDDGREREHRRKHHKHHKRDREYREHRDKERKRDRHGSDRDRDRDRDRDGREHKRSRVSHEERGSSSTSNSNGPFWVRESIRVRVVDKRLERGRLYNKKGAVVDVSGVDDFSIRLDDDSKLYEHLRHAHVETALPKRGGTVLILAGPHKLRRGTLLERHSEEAMAVVKLSGDLSVVTCSFDEVAEWVGILGDGLDVADL